MKLNKILTTAAIALAAAVSANAANYNPGDLVLGVYDYSGTVSTALEFNLGAFTKYANGGGQGLVLNIADEMTSVFGAGWASNSNLHWGLAAEITAAARYSVVALGLPETTVGIHNSSFSTVTISTVSNNVNPYTNTTFASLTTAVGDGYSIPASTTGSIKNYDAAAFGTNKGIVGKLTPNASGLTALDLFLFNGNGNNASDPGIYENTFTIDTTTGDINVLAVPEPSSYAMMAIGGLGLFRMFRRRSMLKA